MFLSLPLPVKNTRTVCVRLVCTNPTRPITKVSGRVGVANSDVLEFQSSSFSILNQFMPCLCTFAINQA